MGFRRFLGLLTAAVLLPAAVAAAPRLMLDDNFSVFERQLPKGWSKYETGRAGAITPLALPGGRRAAKLTVADRSQSLGLTRQFPAQAGRYYRATLESAALPDGTQEGAYLQLRFSPYPLKSFGNSAWLHQVPLADYDAASNRTEVTLQAPAGATAATVYIITAGGAPQLALHRFTLEECDEAPAPRPADPQRVPGVLNNFRRDLHRTTALVRAGRPVAAIVAPDTPEYRTLADRINAVVRERTGAELPILPDARYAGADRLDRNLIVLGSRDVNRTASNLYCRHYTLLDGRYPGVGGAVVRSLHNPFGDGRNVLLVGGSDAAGDRKAVELLAARLAAAPAGPTLESGPLTEIVLGRGMVPPASAQDAKMWENAPGSGDAGAFGWNLLSKNLALFYMTGDEKFAREFLRLAFPDDRAAEELNRLDGEFFYANLKNPLGEPYHYNATMLMLYWDLVEEQPVFDADRERITAKFYEQLDRRRRNGDKGIFRLFGIRTAPKFLMDRHWISEALTVYVAGRYFAKYYPCRDGRDAVRQTRMMFATLKQYPAMVVGSLFWYNTFLLPAFDFAVLDGGLREVGNPVLARYVEALTLLSDRTAEDWSSRYSSQRLLRLMAFLTGNQAPVELAEKRRDFDPGVFRLGQSWYPAAPYRQNFFADTDGRWRIAAFDARGMADWDPPFDRNRVVEWMSFRRRGAAGDDFALVDAKYESGRNAFHNNALISLRLAGVPLLRGYHNQLHLYADGLGDPAISRFAEVLKHGRLGDTAFLRTRLVRFNGFDWVRTMLIRENRFLANFDEVTPLHDMKTAQILVNFETAAGCQAVPTAGREFELRPRGGGAPWTYACSLPASVGQQAVAGASYLDTCGKLSQFAILQPGVRGEAIRFASVLRPGAPAASPSAAQQQDQIALRLPEPALARFDGAGLLLREAGRSFGLGVRGLPGVFTSDVPVDADYQARTGVLEVRADAPAVLRLADGEELRLAAGRTLRRNVAAPEPDPTPAAAAESILAAKPAPADAAAAELPELEKLWERKAGGFVGEAIRFSFEGRPQLVAAVDDRAVWMEADGTVRREFRTSGTVGALCWWPERQLLLVGSIDEKTRAFRPDGTEVWNFTSRMPDGIKHERMWWAKGEMPGVCQIAVAELEPGRPLIFLGGAGTLEILDADGKLLKRQFQEWGTFERFTLLPEHGSTPRAMLSWGFMVGHPTVYRYGADLRSSSFEICSAANGSFMGGYGFGYVGRSHLKVLSLAPGAPPVLVGTFNGTLNRVMIWDLDGKVRREADLGFGVRAFGGIPYAKTMLRATNIRGMETVDFDGGGEISIAIAFDRRFVIAFDRELATRFFTPLPENPLQLTSYRGADGRARLAVAVADGRIFTIDGDGRLTARAAIDGRPTLLRVLDGVLIAGNDRGELRAFRLP